ncbi:MAG: hypothetical protein KatS3mg109_0108 [Pirellulaceae bacterium]|nr:MAG: hypothetical protein KatS3mg109_0108 [Pirellulaceae bacterium]
MVKLRLKPQRKTGLFEGHAGVSLRWNNVRATIPAVEFLHKHGVEVIPAEPASLGYLVRLGDSVPHGIVAVRLPIAPYAAIRTSEELPFPDEYDDGWLQADWTPCPKCGAPLIWYEAGYVPGYRVCAKPPHHHCVVEFSGGKHE